MLGAHRAGANGDPSVGESERNDVAKEVRARLQLVFAKTVREVLDAAFVPGSLPWHVADAHHPFVESNFKREDWPSRK